MHGALVDDEAGVAEVFEEGGEVGFELFGQVVEAGVDAGLGEAFGQALDEAAALDDGFARFADGGAEGVDGEVGVEGFETVVGSVDTGSGGVEILSVPYSFSRRRTPGDCSGGLQSPAKLVSLVGWKPALQTVPLDFRELRGYGDFHETSDHRRTASSRRFSPDGDAQGDESQQAGEEKAGPLGSSLTFGGSWRVSHRWEQSLKNLRRIAMPRTKKLKNHPINAIVKG